MENFTGLFKAAITVILVLFVCFSFFDCTKDSGKKIVTCNLPAKISFNKDVLPVLNTNCSIAGCHAGANPTGNLNLESSQAYSNLLKQGRGYVDTLHPNYSLLYAQMVSSSTPMPPTGNLDSCTTSIILRWIEQKASNN